MDITGVGTYDVTFTVENPKTGCKTTVSKPGLIAIGTKADFSRDSMACLNTPVQLNNTSFNSPDTFSWKVTSQPSGSKATFVGTKLNASATESYDMSPKISFDQVGVYTIQLQTGRQGKASCVSTVSKTITVTQPKASFFSKDTLGICAPKFATFKSTAPGMKSYRWNFGDDTKWYTYAGPDAFHNYTLNNNKGYDVTLVVESQFGCLDTLKKDSFIVLVGSEPKFTVTPQRGLCGGGEATFTNLSKYIVKFSLDYKDTTSYFDTIPFTTKKHFYSYTDYSKDSITYYPDLTTSDSSKNPCYTTYTQTITLYRPPMAQFTAKGGTVNASGQIEGCAPFKVDFKDDSRYNDSAYFDFEGNGVYTSVKAGGLLTHAYTTPGTYSVRLKATNAHCSDTTSKMFYIYVKPAPKADFTAAPTQVCPNADVIFTNSSTAGSAAVTSYLWDFGDTTNGPERGDKDPSHRYTFDGYKNVKLIVENSVGCKDSITKTNVVYVSSGTIPTTPVIRVVSVDTSVAGTGATRVTWEKYPGNPLDFTSYSLHKAGFTAPIFSTGDVNVTNFADNDPSIDVNNATYTYTIRVANPCGKVSAPSDSHSTVRLSVTPNSVGTPTSNNLTWTPYSGWNSLGGPRAYEIYRRDSFANGFGYSLIATVPGNQTGFVDTGLCNMNYRYVLVAVHPVDVTIRSFSNKVQQRPNYAFQSEPLVLRHATVSGQSVLVKWEPGLQRNIRKYIIERSEQSAPTDFIEIGTTDPFTTTFVDEKVDVDASSYTYRVIVEDRCGNRTDGENGAVEPSNVGTTMLLLDLTNSDQDQYQFSWNHYDQFEAGAPTYYLQLRDNQGNWNTVKTVGPVNSDFYDSVHNEIDSATCFRVLAVSPPTTVFPYVVDSSISNVVCPILASRVYIPNAFTPGVSKDINDQFGLKSVSIFSNVKNEDLRFHMEVFDRWGQRVFETNDKNKSWDGKRNGVDLPEGVYIYKIKAQGMDRKPFFKTGYINLVK